MKTRSGTISMVMLLAVILTAAANLVAEEAGQTQEQPLQLHARAMLVSIPAEEFREFSIKDDELEFPSAIDIVKILLSSDDAELITSAKTLNVRSGKIKMQSTHKSTYQRQFTVRYVTPTATTTERPIFPEGCEFHIQSYDNICMLKFNCTWHEVIPFEEICDKDSETKQDKVESYTFDCDTSVLFNLGETLTASYQKSGDNYLILLINISDK